MFDFKRELAVLASEKPITAERENTSSVKITVEAFDAKVAKLLKKQNAANFQLDEMMILLETNTEAEKKQAQERQKFLSALIGIADSIEEYYLYYQENPQEDLTRQSELMWKSCCKSVASTGLFRIADELSPLDVQLNTVVGVGKEPSYPPGSILKVIKSGYKFQDTVIRKSQVIVNKLEGQ